MNTVLRALRLPWVGATILFLTLALWLNQSVSATAWGDVRDRVFRDHTATVSESVRYPFIFLYRHSLDEELYFHVSGAVLGKPYDASFLESIRGDTRGGAPVIPPSNGRPLAPYAEVPLEYPPLALPFLLAPRLLANDLERYTFLFSLEMALVLFAAFHVTIRAVTESKRAQLYLLATLTSLLAGALLIQRLDAVVALCLAAAFAAWVRRAPVQVAFWLGVASAYKLTPALLVLPIFASDRLFVRNARKFALTLAGTTLLGIAPMFFMSSHAFGSLLRYHAERGLHCESTWAALYGLFGGMGHAATVSFGSLNLEGTTPAFLAKLALPVTVLGLAAFSAHLYRLTQKTEDRTSEQKLRVLCAACVLLWLPSKVFSPQYLTWGVPLVVPLLVTMRDRKSALLFAAALLMTQIYVRGYYDAVSTERNALGVGTLLVRALLLAGAAALFVKNLAGEVPTSSAARSH